MNWIELLFTVNEMSSFFDKMSLYYPKLKLDFQQPTISIGENFVDIIDAYVLLLTVRLAAPPSYLCL